VSQQDLDVALRNLVPSVSQLEMEHYTTIQRKFSQEVPAEPPFRDVDGPATQVHAMDRQSSVLMANGPLSPRTRKGKGKARDEAD
jgi:hypothetical protein